MLSELVSGLHFVEPQVDDAGLRKLAQSQGWQVLTIDLNDVRSKRELMWMFQQALSFPAYFGKNWDAMVDMLRDMSWLDARGYLIILRGMGEFAAYDHDAYATFLDILRTVTEEAIANARRVPIKFIVHSNT